MSLHVGRPDPPPAETRSLERFPLRHEVTVRWGDMDALGHVNNTVYFRFFESARIELFERVGLSIADTRSTGPILAQARCDFRRPVHYPARLVVGTRVAEIRNTSLTVEYTLVDAADPTAAPYATGDSILVLYDYAVGSKVPIDDAMRSRLEAFR